MSTDVWGLLPKSQDDDETIEEAINRLISAHEADPEAHTGENEAIAVHRENDIIDHLAGSVKADKLTMTEYELFDSFASVDAWTAVLGTIQNVGYALQVNKVAGGAYVAQAFASIPFYNAANFGTKEMVLQFLAQPFASSGTKFFVFAVGSYWNNPTDGFGIKIEFDGITLYVDKGGNRSFGTKFSGTFTDWHLYRVHIVPIEGVIRLFADGQQCDEISIPDDESIGEDVDFNINVSQGTSGSASLRVSELYLAQQI
jgi:hypothetical protein